MSATRNVLVLVAVLGFAAQVNAAAITWNTPFDISQTAGADDLIAGGTIVTALNLGENPSGGFPTVSVTNSTETIVFTSDNTMMPANASGTFYGNPTGNTDLDKILDSHGYRGGGAGTQLITLTGLTINTPYLIQAVGAADTRSCCSGRTQTLEDLEAVPNVSGAFSRGGVGSVVGTFTADAVTQDMNLVGGNDPGLSLLLVREVPEPATLALAAVGLLGLRRRRRS